MGAFTACPLAFRFAYLERLPEPPSAPASKGTLVHRALELLHTRAAERRTRDAARADLATAARELEEHPEFAGLELSTEEWAAFVDDAATFVERYFDLEDPAAVRSIGLELKLQAQVDVPPLRAGDPYHTVHLRGIIDRLDLDDDGELVVTDYKTGSAPSERWEQRSLAGVHVYALLCEQTFKRRPTRVQLLYLSKPEAIVSVPTDATVHGVEIKTAAVVRAVRRANERDDFRPRPSALCDFCSFREFCPSFGGDPSSARAVLIERERTAAGQPPLPFPTA
jgi:putative RecB family exonuclease